jgi:predicted metal-binding membrane protein
MSGHAHAGIAFFPLVLVWFGMMAAMMAPTACPWVRAFHRFSGRERAAAVGDTLRFSLGYLAAWLGYSIAAAVAQTTLHTAGLMQPARDFAIAPIGAAVLLLAGLYQFAPLKRACLTHCRSPFGYFLTRWRGGPIGAVRMGLHHGLFCVACCWAVMATAFAVGVMNVWWMVVLGGLALAEQIAPWGQMPRRLIGIAFLVAGFGRLGLLARGL